VNRRAFITCTSEAFFCSHILELPCGAHMASFQHVAGETIDYGPKHLQGADWLFLAGIRHEHRSEQGSPGVASNSVFIQEGYGRVAQMSASSAEAPVAGAAPWQIEMRQDRLTAERPPLFSPGLLIQYFAGRPVVVLRGCNYGDHFTIPRTSSFLTFDSTIVATNRRK